MAFEVLDNVILEGDPTDNAEIRLTVVTSAELLERDIGGAIRVSNPGEDIDSKDLVV